MVYFFTVGQERKAFEIAMWIFSNKKKNGVWKGLVMQTKFLFKCKKLRFNAVSEVLVIYQELSGIAKFLGEKIFEHVRWFFSANQFQIFLKIFKGKLEKIWSKKPPLNLKNSKFLFFYMLWSRNFLLKYLFNLFDCYWQTNRQACTETTIKS